jgi:hypothetical protein
MLIESLIKRVGGTHVQLGNDIYHFSNHIKDDPRHVCDVDDEDHIQTFLAIKEGYRIVKVPKKARPDPALAAQQIAADATKKEAEAKPAADPTAADAAAKAK